MNTTLKPIKKRKSINGFVLLFTVLIIGAILTYILPAGEYTRAMVNGHNAVIPDTYKTLGNTPTSFLELFTSIHQGLVEGGPILFYVIIIGGMFSVINSTGAIDALLSSASKKLVNKDLVFIAVLMFIFSMGGALVGMGEEALIYVPLIIPVALSLGFDVIAGTFIVVFGMGTGFTTAIMNPFTVGIAQSIAGLPMFSGILVRLSVYVFMYVLAVAFVYRYTLKVKKDTNFGFFGDGKYKMRNNPNAADIEFQLKHKLILGVFLIGIASLVFGTMKYGWYMGEMSAVFIIVTILVALISRMSSDELIKYFLKGAENILPGALLIGLAKAIVVVLTNGNIIDTILYQSASLLQTVPSSISVVGMFIVQGLIHFLVPSGSGQAMLTMPIMVPLADLLHVTRQTACLIFSLADGIGNSIYPTSGILMATLAIAGIPYGKWLKAIWPLIVGQVAIALIATITANILHYGPF